MHYRVYFKLRCRGVLYTLQGLFQVEMSRCVIYITGCISS